MLGTDAPAPPAQHIRQQGEGPGPPTCTLQPYTRGGSSHPVAAPPSCTRAPCQVTAPASPHCLGTHGVGRKRGGPGSGAWQPLLPQGLVLGEMPGQLHERVGAPALRLHQLPHRHRGRGAPRRLRLCTHESGSTAVRGSPHPPARPGPARHGTARHSPRAARGRPLPTRRQPGSARLAAGPGRRGAGPHLKGPGAPRAGLGAGVRAALTSVSRAAAAAGNPGAGGRSGETPPAPALRRAAGGSVDSHTNTTSGRRRTAAASQPAGRSRELQGSS